MNKTTKPVPAGQLTLSFTTPILTAAQQAARPDRETRLAAAHAVLSRGLSGVRDDPRALAAYLDFAARFRDYSPRNTMLVYMQRPTARFCAGFRTWMQHGRRVRAGERGLTIYAPVTRRATKAEIAAGGDPDEVSVVGFRTATVFDFEQTEAFRDDALVYVPPTARLSADGPEGLVRRLESVATALGYTVVYAETGYADGRCRFDQRLITVRSTLSGADRASVLTHEIAHALAHDPSRGDRPSRASMEVQAEGSAFVALNAMGLDTARASLPYLKGWAGGGDDALLAELSAIDRIARDLLARIEAV